MSCLLYGTQRWRRRSKQQLRLEPLCRFCWRMFGKVTPAEVADHVEPHGGDEQKFWNNELQSLCKTCHDSLKQQLERTGSIVGNCTHGYPIDPNHPWNRDGGCRQCKPTGGVGDSDRASTATARPRPEESVRTLRAKFSIA